MPNVFIYLTLVSRRLNDSLPINKVCFNPQSGEFHFNRLKRPPVLRDMEGGLFLFAAPAKSCDAAVRSTVIMGEKHYALRVMQLD